MKTRVGVLVSGSGTNLQALIDALGMDDSAAELAVVISNRADAFGLERARGANIPAVHIKHKGRKREEFDAELVTVLREHGVEWVVLAGFMRILTPVFLDAFTGRVINIHPALLPSFPGLHGQQQAFDAGVQVAGATVHFVDGGMDTGPIIAQGAVPRLTDDTVETLSARILSVEHQLLPMVVRWAAEGRLRLSDQGIELELLPDEARWVWGG